MQNKLTISSLDGYGLSNYESKCYLSLLEKKNLTASEVSRLASIPGGRIYDILEQLEFKGLCRTISGKVKLYSAVDPSQLKEVLVSLDKKKTDSKIDKLNAEIKKEKDRLVERIKNTEKLIEELTPVYHKSRENDNYIDYIETLKDPIPIHNKVFDLLANAKKEILAFTKPPYAVAERVEEHKDQCDSALRRGVIIKNIYEIPEDKENIKDLATEIERCRLEGEEGRVIEELPIKLIILDEETVVYSLKDPLTLKTSIICNIVKHENLARVFKAAYESYWDKAQSPEILKNRI